MNSLLTIFTNCTTKTIRTVTGKCIYMIHTGSPIFTCFSGAFINIYGCQKKQIRKFLVILSPIHNNHGDKLQISEIVIQYIEIKGVAFKDITFHVLASIQIIQSWGSKEETIIYLRVPLLYLLAFLSFLFSAKTLYNEERKK